jgi:hypothetical protein
MFSFMQPDDPEFMAQLEANRARRAEEEKARQARLAAEYQEKRRKEQYVLDKELAVIRVRAGLVKCSHGEYRS